MRPARVAGRTYALGSCPVTRSRAGYAVGKPEGPGRCQTRPVRSEAMPLHALDDSGQPVRVLEGGPRRASCAECGAPMRARTGSVRIWHWRTWCTTRAARRPGQPNGTWPGRCWPGRAVALRGIELVHSLGRQPSREHGRHHALWDWGHRNARSSAARISMRRLVWLLAVQSAGPGFLGDYRGVFPISQVGNQIAEYVLIHRVPSRSNAARRLSVTSRAGQRGNRCVLGHLLAQQLVACGERALDVQPQARRPGAAAAGWEHGQERPGRRPVGDAGRRVCCPAAGAARDRSVGQKRGRYRVGQEVGIGTQSPAAVEHEQFVDLDRVVRPQDVTCLVHRDPLAQQPFGA